MMTTNSDPILDEFHRTRQQMAEKFGGDITVILEDAWKRQEALKHPIWQGSSKQELNLAGNKSAR